MQSEQEVNKHAGLALTVQEWIKLRHQLAADHTQDLLLQRLTEEIEIIANVNPDRATDILTALATSGDTADRVTAAIYVGALFDVRPQKAKELLTTLLQDPDDEISEKAFETLEEVIDTGVLSTAEAARLAQARYTTHPPRSH